MRTFRIPVLVSAPWVGEQIAAKASQSQFSKKVKKPNLRILETSWLAYFKGFDGYKNFYSVAHIPSSLYFDLNKITPKRDSAVIFNLPDSNIFQDHVEELGISSSTHVILYDRVDSKPSFRTWFLFRLFGHNQVSVLDGGLRQWITHGLPVTNEEPEVERGNFVPKLCPHLLCDYEYMEKNVSSKTDQVLDSRGYKSYSGDKKDPSSGHIPNSVNIPYASLYNVDGTFRSVEELDRIFKKAEVCLTKPIVASCQAGITACSLIAATYMLGRDDVPLYNGSFGEWSARADPSNIAKVKKE